MTRKNHTLRGIFQFFGILTVLLGVAALAQVKGAGQAYAKPQAASALPVRKPTLTVLYSFTGTGGDGYFPSARLVRDAAGNLYGTTEKGGASGPGTVFKLDATGKETVLHSFTGTGADGDYPYAGLIRDASGNLYGTTLLGGSFSEGTVFKLDATGKETVLYTFTGGADGGFPAAGLIRDAAGNLYSTTEFGGASGFGTVFKLDTTGTETVLYSFTGRPDGGFPVASLIRDAAGNLYSTTYGGGAANFGTVFKLDTTGKETVLHSFAGADGKQPVTGLVRDAAGNLYGTTQIGGIANLGTVFKLDTTGTETVLHNFIGGDGRNPTAGLIRDAAGNLYGTTQGGGGFHGGTVFKLDTTGAETVLHRFKGAEGANPCASLIRDTSGNLYGTTLQGGASGLGTVFKLTP